MLGFMEQEGLLYTTRFIKEPAFMESYAHNWTSCAPVSLLGRSEVQLTQADRQLTEQIAEQYGVRQQDGRLVLNGTELTDLLTDSIFAVGTFRLSQHLTRLNIPVYR
jgi:Carboxylesterase family